MIPLELLLVVKLRTFKIEADIFFTWTDTDACNIKIEFKYRIKLLLLMTIKFQMIYFLNRFQRWLTSVSIHSWTNKYEILYATSGNIFRDICICIWIILAFSVQFEITFHLVIYNLCFSFTCMIDLCVISLRWFSELLQVLWKVQCIPV